MKTETQSEGKRDKERDGGFDKRFSVVAPAGSSMEREFSSLCQPDDGISPQSTMTSRSNVATRPKAWKTDDEEVHHLADSTFIPSSYAENRVFKKEHIEKIKHANRSVTTFRSKRLSQNVADTDVEDTRPRITEHGTVKSGDEVEEKFSLKSSKTRMTLSMIEGKPDASRFRESKASQEAEKSTIIGKIYSSEHSLLDVQVDDRSEVPMVLLPGAVSVCGTGFISNDFTFPTRDISSNPTDQGEHYEQELATMLNATLVDDSAFVSASIVDSQAEKKANLRRCIRAYVVSVLVTIVLAVIITIAMKFSKKKSTSSTVSNNLSLAPSNSPSASPSINLLQFLSRNSFDDGSALSIGGSPQHQARVWLEKSVNHGSVDDYNLLQFYVLAVLYYATSGITWKSNPSASKSQWLQQNSKFEFNFCDWYGVDCKGAVITKLNLANQKLDGSIPQELALISSLTFLSLNANFLNGQLPTQIGLMSSLVNLDLSENSITGSLPTEIGKLKSLIRLSLYSNTFTGTLPNEFGLWEALVDLQFQDNAFTGTIPTNVGLMQYLTNLDLDTNVLTGSIPTEIKLLTSLRGLQLNANNFTGTLVTVIGLLTKLEYIDLYSNSFTGTLPTEIGLLKNLEALWLFNNNLSGTLPTTIGVLKYLTELGLQNNRFTGTVPTEIRLLTSLTALGLSNNSFNDTAIPDDFGTFNY